MSDFTTTAFSPTQAARRLAPRLWLFVWLGLAFLVGGILVTPAAVSLAFTTSSAAVFALSLLIIIFNRRYLASRQHFHESLDAFVHNDNTPTFCMAEDGSITYANRAARRRFGDPGDRSMVMLLSRYVANPVNLIFRLQRKARAGGVAEQDVVTENGHMRLTARHLAPAGFVWRMEELTGIGDEGPQAPGPVALPMCLAAADGTVLHMNHALFRLLGRRIAHLDRLLADLPAMDGATCRIDTREGTETRRLLILARRGGRQEIHFLPVAKTDAADPEARIFDELPVGLIRLSSDGTIRQANRMACWLLGDQARPGAQLADLVQGPGRAVADWVHAAAEGRALNRSEVVRARRTAKETHVQISLGRVAGEGEVALIAVLSDATEIKTLEAQFVQSQKMQAIGQLAGGVAHDFNNLLTAIIGYCDLLLMRHDAGDPDYGDLVQIGQNANRAAALVSQLLAYSRKQNLEPERIDMREVLSDLSHLLNRLLGEKVRLDVARSDDLDLVRADRRQLEQVLMNLVVNARDAMEGEGTIRIETGNRALVEEMRRDRAVVEPGNYVSIRVSDTGSGIAPDQVEKIFEPFFTTKKTGEGTGLGLSMVYGIVKQTGGFVFVESAPGQGTEFEILLPAVAREAPRETAPGTAAAAAPAPAAVGARILLVEDEAPVRGFAARALRMRGLEVLEAGDGESALALLAGESQPVDVFVTDVIMPGMDGPTWVREALKTHAGVRVVFVSGYARDSFAAQRAQIPNSVFLPKPFSLRELTDCVQAQVASGPAPQSIEA